MMSYPYIDRVANEFGPESAKELSIFQAEQVYAMKKVAEIERLECDLILTRCMESLSHPTPAARQREIYERQLQAGLDYIKDVDFNGPNFEERVASSHHAGIDF